mmetsp:Transcript_64432/g.141289  ORF Transcript_64432/g.141289 Transcript_64432/m.141289 type:complete len:240 (-) Transcript_64432:130-849(-)
MLFRTIRTRRLWGSLPLRGWWCWRRLPGPLARSRRKFGFRLPSGARHACRIEARRARRRGGCLEFGWPSIIGSILCRFSGILRKPVLRLPSRRGRGRALQRSLLFWLCLQPWWASEVRPGCPRRCLALMFGLQGIWRCLEIALRFFRRRALDAPGWIDPTGRAARGLWSKRRLWLFRHGDINLWSSGHLGFQLSHLLQQIVHDLQSLIRILCLLFCHLALHFPMLAFCFSFLALILGIL